MKTYNNFIATRPFPSDGRYVKTQIKSGFAMSDQKTSLQALEVVFECHDIPELKPGYKVYVRSDTFVHQWAKEEFQDENGAYILVPKQFIFGYESPR